MKEGFQVTVGNIKLSDKAKQYVNTVLDTNRLSYGPFSKKFEDLFAKTHNSKFGIFSNSGTSALQLALHTLKEIHNWEDQAEVIIPAVTFVATANIVIQNNMKPIFVDVEKDTYHIDPKLIEEAITEKTKAIIPVHLFGMPCDMEKIMEIANKNNLKVIEDSCECMFARHHEKSVGSFGDISCFSTYAAHLLITGVGGLNLTNNQEYATKLRSLMNHGRDSSYLSIDDDKDKTEEELKEIVKKRFSFVSLGYSYRCTEMEAAIGLAQLEDYETMIKKRREKASYLIENLKQYEDKIQLPKIRDNTEHSFMMFPIVMKNETKERMVNYLEKNGIETRDMLPLTNQPIYEKIGIKEEDYPNSKWINENGFYIGSHQDLSQEDLDHIIKVMDEALNER